jgi:hypothetical protein
VQSNPLQVRQRQEPYPCPWRPTHFGGRGPRAREVADAARRRRGVPSRRLCLWQHHHYGRAHCVRSNVLPPALVVLSVVSIVVAQNLGCSFLLLRLCFIELLRCTQHFSKLLTFLSGLVLFKVLLLFRTSLHCACRICHFHGRAVAFGIATRASVPQLILVDVSLNARLLSKLGIWQHATPDSCWFVQDTSSRRKRLRS